MMNTIPPVPSDRPDGAAYKSTPRIIPKNLEVPRREDSVQLGQGPVPVEEAMQMVVERSMEKLRSVVGQAREELGLPEGVQIDTSPEATANRIADFALGFFDKYAENNGIENNEEGRRQYAEFIGGAIAQGIDEARGILQSLNALNPDVTANIDKTAGLVQQRLDDFAANGLS